METKFEIAVSTAGDSAEIARILRATFDHSLPYLPKLHTPEEDFYFIRDQVFVKCRVLAARSDEKIVGFCAYREGWIDHLYILPEYQGQGIGPMLLEQAMQAYDEFQLWTFQKNDRARKFYEARGFVIAEMTNGEGNEEKEPDIRYHWRRGSQIRD